MVTLRRMTGDEFSAWREKSILGYAEDLAQATGVGVESARERARNQFSELLPDGSASERTWLLRVLDDSDVDVGVLWIGPHPEQGGTAFVYDIEIAEQYRGRGLGTAAMTAAEGLAAQAGFAQISLNVFGFNDTARRVYDSLGYRVVSTVMSKSLADAGEPDPAEA
jgi:ribosomal protein S18 acetylase RimI-like enzyme